MISIEVVISNNENIMNNIPENNVNTSVNIADNQTSQRNIHRDETLNIIKCINILCFSDCCTYISLYIILIVSVLIFFLLLFSAIIAFFYEIIVNHRIPIRIGENPYILI